jgi:two-component system chemotaxis response regulator CheY
MAKTILIVDDSTSMRSMISFSLKGAGYTVVEATTGKDGLTKAKSNVFDLVLTDQNMPEMDGLTLASSLHKTARYQKTPILMLTTETADKMKQQGKDAGLTGWLTKPFDPNKLLEIVKKVLG